MPARPVRLDHPVPPATSPPRGFPILATVAPVVVAIALWMLTRSVFTLAFAALGPLLAVASVGDDRLRGRSQRRREHERFRAECAEVERAIDEAHDDERRGRERAEPTVRELLRRVGHDPERWTGDAARPLPVRLGTAAARSALDYASASLSSREAAPVAAELQRLVEHAAVLQGAPFSVDARGGIAVVGDGIAAVAVARAVVVQLAIALSPASWSIELPRHGWEWALHLPHSPSRGTTHEVRFRHDGSEVVVTTVPPDAVVSRTVRTVVACSAGGDATVLRHDGDVPAGEMVAPLPLRLQLLGEEESRAAAQLLAQRAQIESVRHGVDALPPAVGFAALAALADSVGSETDLAAVVGVSASGPTVVDLVSDGPHAIVGGTTGSGKSEFLITWILAMLRGRSPQQVTFLGVDFKGGATFDAIRDLPHCVGVITDLDAEECRRALASLGAELRHREAELAAHGLRSLDQAAGGLPFPRLVVVVDEYAALAAADPELHALFSDIAARGRSLGIHLILCTQRPAGVIREAVFANAPLRVCLRVASAADSVAVIGDTHAAEIRPSRKGLGVVGVIGGEMALVQFGLSADTDIAAARVPASAAPPPRRPWCPPLPARIALGDLPPPSRPGIPIGLLDLPEEQTQRTACYDPSGMGPLLVLGAHGSGKSELLAAVAAGSPGVRVVRVGADYSTLWDAVTWALDDDPVRVPESSADVAETSPGSPERSTLLLADDVDAAIAACPIEYRGELVDRLIRVLREGPSRGIVTVATMQRIPSDAHGVGSVAGTRLLLRMPGRSDYVLAGGTAALHLADAPPGRGEWQGARVQLALIDDRALPVTSREAALDVSDVVIATTPKLLVVSARPPQTRELIAAVLADTAVEAPPVNTADEWFGGWASAYRAGESTVVFDGCSHADIRMLTRVRELPPPWPAATRPLWVLLPSGRLARARLR